MRSKYAACALVSAEAATVAGADLQADACLILTLAAACFLALCLRGPHH